MEGKNNVGIGLFPILTLLFLLIAIFLITISGFTFGQSVTDPNQTISSGFRASRVLSSYPNQIFPDENYWSLVGKEITHKFTNAVPSSIWIVSLYQGDGKTRLGFPGVNNGNILYSDEDLNDKYLSKFDSEGFKIYLQVEPGAADVVELIDLVLKRYGHHSSIAGFGVDVEWLDAQAFHNGRKVTDEEAKTWELKVKSFNPAYKLFLKHFDKEIMPTHYRGDIIFIDDATQFSSLNEMIENFSSWGKYFKNNSVGFQYGYPDDKIWWQYLSDPAKEIGNSILNSVSNAAELYWVDFSINSIFPIVTGVEDITISPNEFGLEQNFPNPFNPSTKIRFKIPSNSELHSANVKLIVYDLLGNEITKLVDEPKSPGNYEVTFDAKDLSSGVYFYQLSVNDLRKTKRMVLLK